MTTTTLTWEQKEVTVAMGSPTSRRKLDEATAEGWEPYGVLAADTWSVTHYLKRSRP